MITDKILLDLVDGNLNQEKSKEIMNQINHNDELKNRYEAFVNMDGIMHNDQDVKPSYTFTDKVMASLGKKLSQTSMNGTFWKKNMIVVIMIVGISLVAALTLLTNFSLSEIFPALEPTEFTITEKTISFDPSKLNLINQDLFIKGIIYLNAFIALFLLEKAVLRPYFRHRRHNYSY